MRGRRSASGPSPAVRRQSGRGPELPFLNSSSINLVEANPMPAPRHSSPEKQFVWEFCSENKVLLDTTIAAQEALIHGYTHWRGGINNIQRAGLAENLTAGRDLFLLLGDYFAHKWAHQGFRKQSLAAGRKPEIYHQPALERHASASSRALQKKIDSKSFSSYNEGNFTKGGDSGCLS